MPVRDTYGKLYGFVARSLGTNDGPKTLSFLDGNRGAWYPCAGAKEVIIVEDQLSAIRASRYLHAVALLGTNLSDELLSALVQQGYDSVHLALDKDAYDKAVKTALRIRNKLKVYVPRLDKDIKDLSEEQLVDWLIKESVLHIPQDIKEVSK
jgi:DNA primase